MLLGLADERFEVRYECGRALLKLTDGACTIVISKEKALAAIQCEISREAPLLNELHPPTDDARALHEGDHDHGDDQDLIDQLKRDRVNRSLEHIFTILCLHLEREPLRIAYRALHHQDPKYRGTALEYLSTVLPPEVRELVWPYFSESTPLPTARATHELLADLRRAQESA